MVASTAYKPELREEKIARLTEAAYQAILEKGFRGSFLELELSLWKTIREKVEHAERPSVQAF